MPGREARSDSEYERRGTANVFCAVEPKAGWFTRIYCEQSRFFQAKNGAKIEAIRGLLTTLERSGRDHGEFAEALRSRLATTTTRLPNGGST